MTSYPDPKGDPMSEPLEHEHPQEGWKAGHDVGAADPSGLRAAVTAIAVEVIPRGMTAQVYRRSVLRRLDAALSQETDTADLLDATAVPGQSDAQVGSEQAMWYEAGWVERGQAIRRAALLDPTPRS